MRVNRALARVSRALARVLLSVNGAFPGSAFRLGNYCLPGQATRAVSTFHLTKKTSHFTPPMNDREIRRYDMFGRVKTFGTDNAADFAAGGEAQKRFANVGKVITDGETTPPKP